MSCNAPLPGETRRKARWSDRLSVKKGRSPGQIMLGFIQPLARGSRAENFSPTAVASRLPATLASPGWTSDNRQSLSFAEQDYDRAMTEYNRYLHLEPATPEAPFATLRIGESLPEYHGRF